MLMETRQLFACSSFPNKVFLFLRNIAIDNRYEILGFPLDQPLRGFVIGKHILLLPYVVWPISIQPNKTRCNCIKIVAMHRINTKALKLRSSRKI